MFRTISISAFRYRYDRGVIRKFCSKITKLIETINLTFEQVEQLLLSFILAIVIMKEGAT